MLGNWFSQPENARRVGQHLLQVMSGFLELTDDARIQRLLRRAVHKAIDKVDLTQTSAMMLEGLTRDNRHQKLLDSLINQLIALLQRDSSRAFIARGIVHWLETEHPLKAKLLPTEWLGEHSAEMVTDAVNTLLDEVTHDRTHQIRQTFDRAVQKLIDNLKSDPDMAQKADNIKAWLKNDETFNHYLGEVWGDLRGWVKNDISSDDSRIKQRIAEAGQWFGETLLRDDALRESLNEHLEQAAHRVAPEFAAFLTCHISDTVKSWQTPAICRGRSSSISVKICSSSASTVPWWGEPSACCCGCSRRSPRCCICILVSNDTIRTIALINIPQGGRDDAQDFPLAEPTRRRAVLPGGVNSV